ncbi:hypothetical protein L4G92_05680 [Neisseria sp. ZJ106]|uniref:Lipoprotein n=1 Tax=Neisseria lisongii TaxID=2912188 RepID=A0AAW5AM24_9NEIS|nr:hypothetical protein [Neisseria lisongii]MCF7521536.1 hypothetical protein [Neisseria lisongii]MCF7529157.1 hypothetical protein [Neisseria lisongii]WCL71035.1 hypothetical protein PJU73_06655 [Neisseria lisongii]
MLKKLFCLAACGCLLAACAETRSPRKPLTQEEAFARCQNTAADADRAGFDACMKDKGFRRKAAAAGL